MALNNSVTLKLNDLLFGIRFQRRGRQATRSDPLLSEKRAEEEAGREREQVHRRSSFLDKNMKEKEAVLLVDEFPGWVSETKVIQLFYFSLRNF